MKIALVTGASSGIGEAVAVELASRGFRVVGTSRRGGSWCPLDVTDPASIERCVGRLGRLDLLVNNAGVLLQGAIEETPDDLARLVFETNFFGLARLTSACLPLLRASRGRIINIGSVACGNAPPLIGYYAASKHALLGLSEALRAELKPFGVDVCLVEPSDFRSRLFAAPLAAARLQAYGPLWRTTEPFFARTRERAEDPARVGRLVAKLALASRTRHRNRVGTWGHLLPVLKTLLPQRAFERFMAKALGLDKIRTDAEEKPTQA
jgi:NAD(P)-dependent dehydrogenase (short-subunit alcohol dehydrogenase family)